MAFLTTLKDAAVVSKGFLADLLEHVGSAKHTPSVIDTSLVVLDSLGLRSSQVVTHNIGLVVDTSTVVGHVWAAFVSFLKDLGQILLSHQVRDFSVGKSVLGGSNSINHLS